MKWVKALQFRTKIILMEYNCKCPEKEVAACFNPGNVNELFVPVSRICMQFCFLKLAAVFEKLHRLFN